MMLNYMILRIIAIPQFKYRALILFVIAFLATWFVFDPILRISKVKNITDAPDGRKYQKTPVPVLGGVAVFFGIVVGLSFFKTMHAYTALFPVICAMFVSLSIGCIDDIIDVNPRLRLFCEIGIALLVIFGSGFCINNFQGLWGVDILSPTIAIPLSVLTFVGVVNALNMIDGVDGLSSGFCILICSVFALVFFLGRDWSFSALAVICAGAMLPFFLHNVFGSKSKMYIGDGGTMMMGAVIAIMVMAALRKKFNFDFWPALAGIGRIALVLSILSVPVADTIRVMLYRLVHGISPFTADRNHLHHLLIRSGFSHIAVTLIELSFNIAVIASCIVAWRLGASVSTQLYVVMAMMIAVDFVPAALLGRMPDRVEDAPTVERHGIWLKIQRLVDGKKNDN